MTVRPVAEGDQEAVRALFKACFGKEMSPQEWIWKYRNSYLGTSAAVAEDSGRLVSHYGGLKVRFYWDGRAIDAYQGCDAMTHPDFQSRGIIIKTALGFYGQNPSREFMFGFPSERHAAVAMKWLGWEKHVYINEMVKEVGAAACLPAGRQGPAGWSASLLKLKTGWKEITALEIDSLWERTKESSGLSLEKKSDYVFWRFRHKPANRYEIISFRNFLGAGIKAFAVVLEDGAELKVLDLIAAEDIELKKILNRIERLAAVKRMKTIRFWMSPRRPEYRQLRDAGYVDKQGIPLTLRVSEGSAFEGPRFFEYYNYAMGDYDAS